MIVMRTVFLWLLLVAAFGLATALLGWWTVPVLGALWGLAATGGRLWLGAALAAAAAWAVLLTLTALAGPVGELAVKLGGVMGVPGVFLVLLTLLFPALLAGSAAELAASARRRLRGSAARPVGR